MPKYVDWIALREAVDRLGESRAQGRLCEYLIFKRALVLSIDPASEEPPRVITGTSNSFFQQAISEWADCSPSAAPGTSYFNPFSAKQDKSNGYRSAKYPSNGPSDTVSGWQGGEKPPFVYVPGSKPKEYVFEESSPDFLKRFFLRAAAGAGDLPRLEDVALWWFRSRDVEPLLVDGELSAAALIDVMVKEVGLLAGEINVLFLPAVSASPPPAE